MRWNEETQRWVNDPKPTKAQTPGAKYQIWEPDTCQKGHPYWGDERVRNGGRVCRVCANENAARWRRKNRKKGSGSGKLQYSRKIEDRLWAKVQLCTHCHGDEDHRRPGPGCTCCWEWTGAVTGDGYGRIRHQEKLWLPHRLVYIWSNGGELPPENWVIDHVCHNRACVRPDHLEAVESRINTIRGVSHRVDNVQLNSIRNQGFLR